MSLNRRVKRISSSSNDDQQQIRAYADYLDRPNIVLLGDPGAGKSHLFRIGSEHESAKLFQARSFTIYVDQSVTGKVVYIDALDEKRSRSDALDAMGFTPYSRQTSLTNRPPSTSFKTLMICVSV